MNTVQKLASLPIALLLATAVFAAVPAGAQLPIYVRPCEGPEDVFCMPQGPGEPSDPCEVAPIPVLCGGGGEPGPCDPADPTTYPEDPEELLTCLMGEEGEPEPCDGTEIPDVACLPVTPPSTGGADCGPTAPDVDPVHFTLCTLLNTASATPLVQNLAYFGDSDADELLDYASFVVGTPTDDPTATADGCGFESDPLGGEDPTGFGMPFPDPSAPIEEDLAGCFVPFATIILQIDASGGDGYLMHIIFVDEPVGTFYGVFPDGEDLLLQNVYISLAGDLDNDGDADINELLSCLSNPTNPASTCRDVDADGLRYRFYLADSAEDCEEGDTFNEEAGECGIDEETNCDASLADEVNDCDPFNPNSDTAVEEAYAGRFPDTRKDGADPYPMDPTDNDADRDGLQSIDEQGANQFNLWCAPTGTVSNPRYEVITPGTYVPYGGKPTGTFSQADGVVTFTPGTAIGCAGGLTDPADVDSDNDGLLDGQEMLTRTGMHTHSNSDSSHNHAVHCRSLITPQDGGNCGGGVGTDPNDPDTDNDGFLDNQEFSVGSNPWDSADHDAEGDGIHDAQETSGANNPYCATTMAGAVKVSHLSKEWDSASFSTYTTKDPTCDASKDNGKPMGAGTFERKQMPQNADPGEEGASTPTDNADSDGDGLSDYEEMTGNYAARVSNGSPTCVNSAGVAYPLNHAVVSDPNNADTDGGGLGDFDDVCGGGNPNDPADDVGCTNLLPFITFDPFLCEEFYGVDDLACNWFGIIPAGTFPECYTGAVCANAPIPVVCPSEPHPCDEPESEACEEFCEENPDEPECVEPEPCDGTDLIVACAPPLPPLPPVLEALDSQDPWDVDGDGKRAESNNQLDLIEQRVLYYDMDEEADSSREKNNDLEGVGGVTIVVLNPTSVSAYPAPLARVHVGDVAASAGQEEVLVIETNTPAGRTVTCVYTIGEDPRLHLALANDGRFNGASATPCGPEVDAIGELNDVLGNVPILEPVVNDADHDGVPESITLQWPDLDECTPVSAGPAGPTPVPDPRTCATDPWVIPLDGSSAPSLPPGTGGIPPLPPPLNDLPATIGAIVTACSTPGPMGPSAECIAAIEDLLPEI